MGDENALIGRIFGTFPLKFSLISVEHGDIFIFTKKYDLTSYLLGDVISEICRYILAHSTCSAIRGRKSSKIKKIPPHIIFKTSTDDVWYIYKNIYKILKSK